MLDTPRYEECDILIVGGGGLFSTQEWMLRLSKWINLIKAKKRVIWGAGIDKEYFDHRLMSKFDMIGTRVADSPFEFVPCVSCLHPDLMYQPEGKGTAIISHPKRLIVKGRKNQSLNTQPFHKTLQEIYPVKSVLTTSYHIYYWSHLIGKECMIVKSDKYSKGLTEKYKTFDEKTLKNAPLEYYRSINKNFAQRVFYG